MEPMFGIVDVDLGRFFGWSNDLNDTLSYAQDCIEVNPGWEKDLAILEFSGDRDNRKITTIYEVGEIPERHAAVT